MGLFGPDKKEYEKKFQQVLQWQSSVFQLSQTILSRYHHNLDGLSKEITAELLKEHSIYAEMAGVWLIDNTDKSKVKCKAFMAHGDDVHARIGLEIDVKDHPFSQCLRETSEEVYQVLSSDKVRELVSQGFLERDWSQYSDIKSGLFIKIMLDATCIGFIELYNQLTRSLPYIEISRKGFSWLNDQEFKDNTQRLMLQIGKTIGLAVTKVQHTKVRSQYYDELIEAKNAHELRCCISRQLKEFSEAECFSYWTYSSRHEELLLKFSSGIVIDKDHMVLNANACWLGEIIDTDKEMIFEKDPSDKYQDPYWREKLGKFQVIGIPLRKVDGKVFAIVSLHFDKSHSIDELLKEKIAKYFKKCATMIMSNRHRLENKRRSEFEARLSKLLLIDGWEGFYDALVVMIKSVMGADACSLLLKDNHELKLRLESTTSERLKDKIGTTVYDLVRGKSITVDVFRDSRQRTVYRRAMDEPNYSKGLCDEIDAQGDASIVFGRIRLGDRSPIGVIRCVKKNEVSADTKNGINIHFHNTFDHHEDKMMQSICQTVSVTSKLIMEARASSLRAIASKQRAIELEHETVTPISIVQHTLDELRFRLRRLSKIDSVDLMEMVDADQYGQKNTVVWSRDTQKHLFGKLDKKGRIAKFEAVRTTTLIKMPNVADIPKNDYYIQKIYLQSLLGDIFHLADHFANVEGLKVARFSPLLAKIRRSEHCVYVDKGLFLQAAMHLIDNAIKYSIPSEKGGRRYGGDIWFEFEQGQVNRNERYLLRVCNVGEAIPERERKKIWEKNTRGEAAKQSGKPGKGLGLYVVKRIMQNMGGDARLLTTQDDETRFELLLP